MIKLYIYSLLAIVLALLVTLYLGFPADPGYLLLAFGNYTFETSLFALLVAAAVVYLLVRLVLLVWNWISPWQWVRYGREFRNSRQAKSRSKTLEGLLYFIRGNWQSAFSLLNTSKRESDANVVNYLAAAYAAYELGDRDAWTRQLNEAETRYPAARSTINSLRAQLLFKSNQLEQCLAVLEQLRKSSLNDAPLLTLLKEVYIKLEAWEQLSDLLGVLEKQKLVSEAELDQIRMRIFMEQLYDAAHSKANANANKQESGNDPRSAELSKIWKKAPAKYRENEKVVRHFVDLLLVVKGKAEASKALEYALSKKWSDALIVLYGLHDYNCSPQQLIQAEGWLKARPANASLLLSLGRISMRNELWGKAREYFEASIKIAPIADAYGELSRLLKGLGDSKASETSLQKYAEMTGAKLPELPLPSAATLSKPVLKSPA